MHNTKKYLMVHKAGAKKGTAGSGMETLLKIIVGLAAVVVILILIIHWKNASIDQSENVARFGSSFLNSFSR